MNFLQFSFVSNMKYKYKIHYVMLLLYLINIYTLYLLIHLFPDEHDSQESEEVNEKLEEIDDETDNLDITFVKMADPRYARKWGVTKLPAIVYFRKRFPSIYRGKKLCGDIA